MTITLFRILLAFKKKTTYCFHSNANHGSFCQSHKNLWLPRDKMWKSLKDDNFAKHKNYK